MGDGQSGRGQRLGNATVVAFALPMLPVMAVEIAWRTYLPMHFAGVVGLPIALVGALMMGARLFDTVIDPAIAWASDRYGTRWGHRRPWMIAGLAPLMTGAALTFFAWPGMGLPSLIGACLLLHLGFMLLITPHGGWALELGRTAGERLRIMTAKTWVPMAGAVLLVALPAYLEREWGADARVQVSALGWMLLALAPLCVLVTVAFVREPQLAAARAAAPANPLAQCRSLLAMPALRPLLLLYFITGLGDAACATMFLFFIDHGLGLRGWGSTLLLVQSGVTLAVLPVWALVGTRLGLWRLLGLAYGWLACLAPVALILPNGQLATASGFIGARALVGGVEFMVLRALVAQVAATSAESGLRQGAGSYAVSNVTLKIAMGGGAWLVLSALGLIGAQVGSPGWVADAGQALAIRLCYAVPMLLCATTGLIVVAVLTRGPRQVASLAG